MKRSYFETPRRSEDCTYHSWADPIIRDDGHNQRDVDMYVMVACAFMAGVLITMAIAGWLS